jgi:hypothetical protein
VTAFSSAFGKHTTLQGFGFLGLSLGLQVWVCSFGSLFSGVSLGSGLGLWIWVSGFGSLSGLGRIDGFGSQGVGLWIWISGSGSLWVSALGLCIWVSLWVWVSLSGLGLRHGSLSGFGSPLGFGSLSRFGSMGLGLWVFVPH